MSHNQQKLKRFVTCSEKTLLWVATQLIGKDWPTLRTLYLESDASGNGLAPTALQGARFPVYIPWLDMDMI